MDNQTTDTTAKQEQLNHVDQQETQEDIDVTDKEESHSTAADGGNDYVEPAGSQAIAEEESEGNLPDPETLSTSSEGEMESEKIDNK